jgi:hypothetical protein
MIPLGIADPGSAQQISELLKGLDPSATIDIPSAPLTDSMALSTLWLRGRL